MKMKNALLVSLLMLGISGAAEAQGCPAENVRERILISGPGQRLDNGSITFPISLNGFDIEPKQLIALSVTQLNDWKVVAGPSSLRVTTATAGGDMNLRCAGYYDAVEGGGDDVGVICATIPYPQGVQDRVSMRVTFCGQ